MVNFVNMYKKVIDKYSAILPWLIIAVTFAGIVFLIWGATGPASYWLSAVLFVVGSMLSAQSATTGNVNSLLSNFKEVIIGSVNIGLKSIQHLEDNPPAKIAANTHGRFLFIGVAGSKFLRDTLQKGDFFRTNSNPSNVQIILMDPFSDEVKKLSKKSGEDFIHRKKIIESIRFLEKLRADGYKFELRLYPKLPPMRLMICDGSITTLSIYTSDSTGWKNAQLIFDTIDTPDSLAPHFESLFNDLWSRALTFNLEIREKALSAIIDSSCEKDSVGMVHGRFQPFHHEHLEYVLWGISKAEKCYIAVTQPDINHLSETKGAPHRANPEGNPFTYEERKRMINLSLSRLGISKERYEIIPFDIDNMEVSFETIKKSNSDKLPSQFMKVFSSWEEHKKNKFIELGFNVVEICEEHKEYAKKNVTGTLVRELIFSNRNWEDYVPYGTQLVVSHSDRAKK